MGITINLQPDKLRKIGEMDPRVQSYNIEMTELTGGTFWKAYTPEQIEGTEPFTIEVDFKDMGAFMQNMMEVVAPINLYGQRIRTLAKALGPVIIRFSGSWATRTYYDFDGHTKGVVPEGFEFILTKEQWQGALDFVKAVDGQILISLANSWGVHKDGTGEWMPTEAKKLWDYTNAQGMTIDYAEFMNEPNFLTGAMLPEGYGPKDFARDHDRFTRWIQKNHPNTKIAGPCAVDTPRLGDVVGSHVEAITAEELIKDLEIKPEIFSYHSYANISERGQFFGKHLTFDKVLSEDYLGCTTEDLGYAKMMRDTYMPGADLWVTESADAGCGGSTWAPTFIETIRYIDELARFNANARGVIFHNTLASSAYGFLDNQTHQPRPQYWAALLFKTLVGEIVYDSQQPIREGVHLYAHSRSDNKPGVCYIYVNNSKDESAEILVDQATLFTLTGEKLRSQEVLLNGQVLRMLDEHTMPEIKGLEIETSTILPPASVSFLLVS